MGAVPAEVGAVILADVTFAGMGTMTVVGTGPMMLVVAGVIAGGVPFVGGTVPLTVGNGGISVTVTVAGGTAVGKPDGGIITMVALIGTVAGTAVPSTVMVSTMPVVTPLDSIGDSGSGLTLPVGTAPTRVVVMGGTITLATTADPLIMRVVRLAVALANGAGVNV